MTTSPNPHLVRRSTKPLALLSFYFRGSVELGDCSSMGLILDRLETFSERRGVCRKCQGTGIKNHKELTAWTALAEEFREKFGGETQYAKLNPPPSSEDCPRCQGTKSVVVSGYSTCRDCRGRRAGCPRCGGTGVVWKNGKGAEITAKPTGSSKDLSSGKEPNYDSIIELARAGRVMAAVPSDHRTVLETFHGSTGDFCEGVHGNRMTSAILCAADMPEHTLLMVSDGEREVTETAVRQLRAALVKTTTANEALAKIREWQTHPDHTDAYRILERAARSIVEAATEAWVRAVEEVAPYETIERHA